MKDKKNRKKKILMILLALLLLLLLCLTIRNCDFSQKKATPKISIGPTGTSSTDVVGQVVDLKVMIDTKDATINAAEVFLNYDPTFLEIISQGRESSILKIWIEEETKFSNQEGNFSFVGGLPTPGFKGTGEVGTIRVKLLKSGKTTISFSDKTKLYLNDGEGTQSAIQLPSMELLIKGQSPIGDKKSSPNTI